MELAACRFVGVLLPTIPIVIWRGDNIYPKGRRIMLLLRSFVGTTGLMLSFYAFRLMPLADASVSIVVSAVYIDMFWFAFYSLISCSCRSLCSVYQCSWPSLLVSS